MSIGKGIGKNKKGLTPELPDLKKFKSTDGVLTPPTE